MLGIWWHFKRAQKVGVVLEIRPEKTCLAVVEFGRNFLHLNFIGDEVEHFEVKLTQIWVRKDTIFCDTTKFS